MYNRSVSTQSDEVTDAPRAWRRPLGTSGLETTALSLGLAALGRPGYLNLGHGEDFDDRSVHGLERRAHEVLDAAYERGGAPLRRGPLLRPGRGVPRLVARARVARARVRHGQLEVGLHLHGGLADRCDPPEVKDLTGRHSAASSRRPESVLGAHLSLYQIHSATLSSGVLDDPEVRAALAALRMEGIASRPERHRHRTGGHDRARRPAPARFDSVQATWNLLERSAEGALRQAHEAGLGVIIKEALANGRLGPRGGNATARGRRRAHGRGASMRSRSRP